MSSTSKITKPNVKIPTLDQRELTVISSFSLSMDLKLLTVAARIA